HFTDFNSSFGTDPNTGAFTATKNDFHYYVTSGVNGNIGRNTFIAPGFQFGRNTFIAPGFQFWNLSAQRTIKFKERYNFLIRGEFYNAFNHPNLGIPTLNLANPNFMNEGITIN